MPFTTEQFFEVFLRYNLGTAPAPVVLYLVAAFLVALALRDDRGSDRWIAGILAFLWAWMGLVYHWGYFADINPAAWLFGALFVLQAVAFLWAGVAHDHLAFRFRADANGLTGAALILYGLAVYPVLGALAGHGFPEGPTFGLPCPTTIVTFGLLLWTTRRVPVRVLVIPALWSLLGASAALQLGVREDLGLLVAGVLGTVLVLARNRRAGAPEPVKAAAA